MVRQGTCRLYHRNKDDVDVEKYREEKYNKLLEENKRMISRIEAFESNAINKVESIRTWRYQDKDRLSVRR